MWKRVDEIFSGPLEPLQKWNRELIDNKQFAHLASYLVQDFRNSPAAKEIAEHYKNLGPTEIKDSSIVNQIMRSGVLRT